MTKSRLIKLSALALSMGLAVGCASTGADKMSQMEEDIASANQNAEAALATANEAKATAGEALGTAQSAQEAADRCSERCDRMFNQSMAK